MPNNLHREKSCSLCNYPADIGNHLFLVPDMLRGSPALKNEVPIPSHYWVGQELHKMVWKNPNELFGQHNILPMPTVQEVGPGYLHFLPGPCLELGLGAHLSTPGLWLHILKASNVTFSIQ